MTEELEAYTGQTGMDELLSDMRENHQDWIADFFEWVEENTEMDEDNHVTYLPIDELRAQEHVEPTKGAELMQAMVFGVYWEQKNPAKPVKENVPDEVLEELAE